MTTETEATQMTMSFQVRLRIKRNGKMRQVLQQWNAEVSDGVNEPRKGYWKDVPIVYTDNDSDFERQDEKCENNKPESVGV